MEKYWNGYISLNDEICIQKNLNLGEIFVVTVCNRSTKVMNPNEIKFEQSEFGAAHNLFRSGGIYSILKPGG